MKKKLERVFAVAVVITSLISVIFGIRFVREQFPQAEAKSVATEPFTVTVTATDNNRAVLMIQDSSDAATTVELIHIGDSTFRATLDRHASGPEITFSNKRVIGVLGKFDKPDLLSNTFYGAMVDDHYELEIQLKQG